MHNTLGQGEQPGQGVTADGAPNGRAAEQGSPASDGFPALGIGPQQSTRGASPDQPAKPPVQEGSGGRWPAGGWARLLQRPAAAGVTPSGQAPLAGTDLPRSVAGGGGAHGEDATDAAPSRTRKAAGAEQLQAEARRSVVDAMTGA